MSQWERSNRTEKLKNSREFRLGYFLIFGSRMPDHSKPVLSLRCPCGPRNGIRMIGNHRFDLAYINTSTLNSCHSYEGWTIQKDFLWNTHQELLGESTRMGNQNRALPVTRQRVELTKHTSSHTSRKMHSNVPALPQSPRCSIARMTPNLVSGE
jgi:hypothetical protein